MAVLTEDDVKVMVAGVANDIPTNDIQCFDNGELYMTFGVFRWNDGTYHDEPELVKE